MGFIKKYDVINKFIAVFIAVILWATVTNIKNPIITYAFQDLIVDLTSTGLIFENNNLIVVSDEFPQVDIKLRGSRDEIANLSSSNVKVSADLSSINEAGQYQISYVVKLPYSTVEVIEKYPEKITVIVDELQIKQIPVQIELVGTPLEDYIYDDIIHKEDITISGPKNEIEKIDYAKIEVDVDKKNIDILGEYDVSLINSIGEVVESEKITQNYKFLDVQLSVSKVKTIPLDIDLEYGEIVSYKKIENYTLDKNQVTIVGDPDTVDRYKNLYIGKINVDDTIDGTNMFTFDLPSLEGIKYLNLENLQVKATISFTDYTTKEFTVSKFSINEEELENTLILTENIVVQISGSEKELLELKSSDIIIEPSVNIKDLEVGTHEIDCVVKVYNDNDFDFNQNYKMIVEVR